MRESAIERYLVKRIQRIGGRCYKLKFLGHDGAPDRLVILPGGEIVWVELKTPNGRTRPAQIRMHQELKAFLQEVLILRTPEVIDARFTIER